MVVQFKAKPISDIPLDVDADPVASILGRVYPRCHGSVWLIIGLGIHDRGDNLSVRPRAGLSGRAEPDGHGVVAMVQFQLGHGVVQRRCKRLDRPPLQGDLPVNAGSLPFIKLVNHLLRQCDDRCFGGQVGLLTVIYDSATRALQPCGVERLRHAGMALLKGARERDADRVIKKRLRNKRR